MMSPGVRLKGTADVLARIRAEFKKVSDGAERGAFAAGLIVQRAAQKGVPREYGNLHASAYTRRIPEVAKVATVEVGFEAVYALWVHENMDQKLKGEPRASGIGVYWGPRGRPRYLALALEENQATVLAAVSRGARL